jgi:hypothetical protein
VIYNSVNIILGNNFTHDASGRRNKSFAVFFARLDDSGMLVGSKRENDRGCCRMLNTIWGYDRIWYNRLDD